MATKSGLSGSNAQKSQCIYDLSVPKNTEDKDPDLEVDLTEEAMINLLQWIKKDQRSGERIQAGSLMGKKL